jgi:hypothetical protein
MYSVAIQEYTGLAKRRKQVRIKIAEKDRDILCWKMYSLVSMLIGDVNFGRRIELL